MRTRSVLATALLSIGGITYTGDWDTALAQNGAQLGRNPAARWCRPSSRRPRAQDNWQEHVVGKTTYNPPIPPLAPAKFTGSVYIAEGSRVRPECTDFSASLQKSTGTYVQTVAPAGAGTTPGMLGYMFWAAERPSTRGVTTSPPNTCQGGVGAGATAYQIPVPMAALRQS
jgi:hypothetical protein